MEKGCRTVIRGQKKKKQNKKKTRKTKKNKKSRQKTKKLTTELSKSNPGDFDLTLIVFILQSIGPLAPCLRVVMLKAKYVSDCSPKDFDNFDIRSVG